jgi:hypothetical protein
MKERIIGEHGGESVGNHPKSISALFGVILWGFGCVMASDPQWDQTIFKVGDMKITL